MITLGQPVRIAACAVLILALPAAAAAQTAGTLRGLVTDDKGAALPGAVVVVSSVSQGISGRAALTDASGVFLVQALPPARYYLVRVRLSTYATIALSGVEVPAGAVGSVRLALSRETALRQHVEVRASPNIVNLEETTTQTRLSSEFVDTLPFLGRDYQDTLTLAPGVTDVDGDGNPNIHGARDTDVVTLVDGVSTTDPLTGKVGAQLNIESIQEIEVKTSGAKAEYSRAQGGFANILTKSGGNEFEGTFKIYWRGSALDGDGAGSDDPRLHAGVGEQGIRQLKFNDLLPFLSVSGPIVKDRAWYFVANEYIRKEDPVNALSAAFVTGVREYREFGKVTWQAGANNRLALSLTYDPQEDLNQGLNSFTREESGFTLKQGGPVLTVRETSVLGPYAALETSLSSFDEHPARVPTLDPDTNHNGTLWEDRNHNGFIEARERDPGEDYDGDGRFDVFEDGNRNGLLDQGEDLDGDRRLTRSGSGTIAGACEGRLREDLDCDGHLDTFDEDTNHNGRLDPGEDVDNDRHLDRGNEDRNGNNILDDTPIPDGLYPYGELAPVPADRDYTFDQRLGITTGPFYESFSDRRRRLTLRQDLSQYVPDAYGSHSLKFGFVVERESFDRSTLSRPIVAPFTRTMREGVSTVSVLLPAEDGVENA